MGRVLGHALQEPNLLLHPTAAPLPRGPRDSLTLSPSPAVCSGSPGPAAGGLSVHPMPNPNATALCTA